MKLKLTVLYRDEKTQEFLCTDFPAIQPPWVTFYLEGFGRNIIHEGCIQEISQEFVEGV